MEYSGILSYLNTKAGSTGSVPILAVNQCQGDCAKMAT